MEHLSARIDALEQQLRTLVAHTQTVEHRLRRWRRLAWALVVLSLVSLGQSASTAQEERPAGQRLGARLAEVEHTLGRWQETFQHVALRADDAGHPEVVISGVNLRIVNGLGSTDCLNEQFEPIPDCPNGLGNLIVGYNEPRPEEEGVENIRTGSHNVVLGREHNFSRFGGLVVGLHNTISGDFAAVSGGANNTASGLYSAVSGGSGNIASGHAAGVSGGRENQASGVSDGLSAPVVSGGAFNTASGFSAVISGGFRRTATGDFDWVAGPLFADE